MMNLLLVAALALAAPVKTVTQTACVSLEGKTDEVAKRELLLVARRGALEHLGSVVRSETRVEDLTLRKDEIQTVSVGYLRLEGEPKFFKGRSPGELCVTIKASTLDEDRAGLPLHGYNRSEILAAIYLGELDDIPDDQPTRKWIFSYLNALSSSCGALPSEVTNQAKHYVRYDTFKDPSGPMIFAGQVISDFIIAMGSYNFDDISKVEQKYALVVAEAEEDGRTLIDRHGCTSNQVKQVKNNIFQIVRERSSHGPADREP
jgi:hypothetical protein